MLNERISHIHCRMQNGMLCEAGIQQVGSGRATLIVERSRTSVYLVSEPRLRTNPSGPCCCSLGILNFLHHPAIQGLMTGTELWAGICSFCCCPGSSVPLSFCLLEACYSSPPSVDTGGRSVPWQYSPGRLPGALLPLNCLKRLPWLLGHPRASACQVGSEVVERQWWWDWHTKGQMPGAYLGPWSSGCALL